MRVVYSLSCDDRVRPEAEYATATCLTTLGFFFDGPQLSGPGTLLSYGELSAESVERVEKGSWAVRIQHHTEMFESMVEQGSMPRIEGWALDPGRFPILGPLEVSSRGTVLVEIERSDGSRFPLVTEERIGEGGLIALNFDMVAAVFFFLSRIEETVGGVVDRFGRFPQEDVLCARGGFELAPAVNGYLDMLRKAVFGAAQRSGVSLLRKLEWPGGEDYCLSLTHDVDRLARWRGRSIIKGFLTGRAAQVVGSLLSIERDPWWKLDAIQKVERERAVRSSFFFFADKGGNRGGRYDPVAIEEVLKELVREGWEVALHGSYESMVDGDRLAGERKRLSLVLGGDVTGVRQHYLRFNIPVSVGCMEGAGFEYDASVGFSDRAGFRASICLPFRLYDLENRRPSSLLELPIAVMDGALPLAATSRQEAMVGLVDAVRDRKGLLSVIWHQRSFDESTFPGLASLYDWFLSRAAADRPYFATQREVASWWRKRGALEIVGIERSGKVFAVSFSAPRGAESVTLELCGSIRLSNARGVRAESLLDRADRFCRLRLSEMEKHAFELEFEETYER